MEDREEEGWKTKRLASWGAAAQLSCSQVDQRLRCSGLRWAAQLSCT